VVVVEKAGVVEGAEVHRGLKESKESIQYPSHYQEEELKEGAILGLVEGNYEFVTLD
jgi:hypothetical protein